MSQTAVLCFHCALYARFQLRLCLAYSAMEQSNLDNGVLPALTFDKTPTHMEQAKVKELIQCIKCDSAYAFPKDKDDCLAHLFMQHRLVIADVEEIALLEDYLQYWRNEFTGHELEEYCTTMLLDQLPDGTPAKNERYYLLSDILPKDFELRRELQQRRLQHALAQHQFERTDRAFSKECLYCRDVVTGLRADYLAHLFNKHFLQLGKPENLVYVDELLAKVQHNLESLICLYCEKLFKDRITLKEHMRKKAHKRINPNNRDYDHFFLLNYRNEKPKLTTAGKSRHAPKKYASTRMEHTPSTAVVEARSPICDFDGHFAAVQSDESDSDWSDWDDAGEKMPPLNCLYCAHKESGFELLKKHMQEVHSVNFDAVLQGLNFYEKIKVVNYVRRQMCLLRCVTCNLRCQDEEALRQHMTSEQHFGCGTKKQWDKPEFFFPTYDDDGLLCVLDDSPNDTTDDAVVRIISEDTMAQINKDAERLSLENFQYL